MMPLLTDSFCHEQSMITRVKPFKPRQEVKEVHFFHEGFDSMTYENVNTYHTK